MYQKTRLMYLFASAGFLLVLVSSWLNTQNAFHATIFAVLAAVVLGVLGREIGRIVDQPLGHRIKNPGWVDELFKKPAKLEEEDEPFVLEQGHRLGDEIFLEDLGK
ncbi:MAG: hypothetical protein KC474_01535 [Cyanobacteria bacterium HKST-UBA04]|nr:hypothetical protein [Cyanobacteria bacterium HKST-UBA04]MCA9840752.1 hypothetical protein [Cyanobacteria bacterium HKST-UBA03]